jgi:hypothetical protein
MVERHLARSGVEDPYDGRLTGNRKADSVARVKPPSGPRKRDPTQRVSAVAVGIRRMEQQQLDPSAAGNPATRQARCDHPRFVEYQQIAGAQVTREIAESGILKLVAVDDHQAAGVANRRGLLRDQLFGQIEAVGGAEPVVDRQSPPIVVPGK